LDANIPEDRVARRIWVTPHATNFSEVLPVVIVQRWAKTAMPQVAYQQGAAIARNLQAIAEVKTLSQHM